MNETFALRALAALLALGALPLPYPYYPALLIVATLGFGLVAYRAAVGRHWPVMLVAGGLAVMFNPVVPVHLPKAHWAVLDAAAAGYAAALSRAVGRPMQPAALSWRALPQVAMVVASGAVAAAVAATALAFVFFLVSHPARWLGYGSPFHELRYLFLPTAVGAAVFVMAAMFYARDD